MTAETATRVAARFAGPLSIALAFVALAAWSWRKWTDPVVDFGLELYLPWQLVEGKVLYRDLAYRNGPLSPYVNALWFSFFGVSIRTLALCNMAILAGIVALVYRTLRRGCDRFTATLCSLALLAVFGFSQYGTIGNYNYVTPYQHSQTQGLLLALVQVALLARAIPARRVAAWSGAGLCLGLLALTKVELFAPALVVAGAGVALAAHRDTASARQLAGFAGAFAAPPLLAFAALASQMPAALALRGLLGNWPYLAEALADDFYLGGAGLDDAIGNVGSMATATSAVAVLIAVLVLVEQRLHERRSGGRTPWWMAFAAGALVFGALAYLGYDFPFEMAARALPAMAALGTLVLMRRAWTRREAPGESELGFALFALLALGLLAKLGLRTQFQHYGFVLAMPATLLLIAQLVHDAPLRSLFEYRSGKIARAVGAALVCAWALYFLRWSHELYSIKDFPVGEGADQILTTQPDYSPRGHAVAATLDALSSVMPDDATLLVLPEGIGFNYWLRRESPSRYGLFLPTELAAHGGDEVVASDLRENPADFVLLVHRNYAEFGTKPFGAEPRSGRALRNWLRADYARMDRVGAEPFRDHRFGIVVLKRTGGSTRR